MEFKVNDISQSEREVEVTLSYDEIRSEIEGEVKKEASKIQVPGVRKGKVPKQIIKQRFGETLEFEASEKVANSRFWQLAKENYLRPIGQPVMTDLDFNIEKDFKFKVKYEVLPEIDVKDYTGQLIEVPDLNVKPEDVEKEIDNLLRSNSSQEEADAIGDDDNFLLDVELKRMDESGQPAADSKPENMQIDLSNENVHPDIKANSRGKKVGEKFKFHFHDERIVQNKDGQDEKVVEYFDYEVLILVITLDVTQQRVITHDNVSVEVDAVVFYQVRDAAKSVVAVENFQKAAFFITQTTLRDVLGQSELDDLLAHREVINQRLQVIIDQATEPWGIKIIAVEVRDVRLPETMQRAMAPQAEAERVKRARVLLAEGEFMASERLTDAGAKISQQPVALQLRYLETLTEIAAEKNSTILFVAPTPRRPGV